MANAGDFLLLLLLGAFLGALGQSLRVIVGNRKRRERGQRFRGSEVLMSLLIGAAAGSLGMLVFVVKEGAGAMALDSTLFASLIAAGYAGADFVEGIMHKVALPVLEGDVVAAPVDATGTARRPAAPLAVPFSARRSTQARGSRHPQRQTPSARSRERHLDANLSAE